MPWVLATSMMCWMATAVTPTTPLKRFARGRGAGVTVGVVLCFEALWSPVVWWAAFIVGTLVSLGSSDTQRFWLGSTERLGAWGPVVLLVPLGGAAIAMLVRPIRWRTLWGVLCLVAALLNALLAIVLAVYNSGFDNGPVGTRLVAIVIGIGFGLVAARMFADGIGFLRPPVAKDVVLPPPPA